MIERKTELKMRKRRVFEDVRNDKQRHEKGEKRKEGKRRMRKRKKVKKTIKRRKNTVEKKRDKNWTREN